MRQPAVILLVSKDAQLMAEARRELRARSVAFEECEPDRLLLGHVKLPAVIVSGKLLQGIEGVRRVADWCAIGF